MSAPVKVGDTVALLHTCAGVDHAADVVIERVTPMGGITGDYRLRATRCDGQPVEWAIRHDGSPAP